MCALRILACSDLLVLKPFPGFSVHKSHGWDLQQFCSCLGCGDLTPGFIENSLGSKHRVMWLEVQYCKLMVGPESQLCQKGLWQSKRRGGRTVLGRPKVSGHHPGGAVAAPMRSKQLFQVSCGFRCSHNGYHCCHSSYNPV